MTFRPLTIFASALAAAMIAGFAASPASAAPLSKAAFERESTQVTLIRDDRGRDRGRHWRGDRGRPHFDRDRQWRGRPHVYYPRARAPRYVYAPPPPPVYYYPYDRYYPYSSFSFSSPGFGFSLGY